MFTILKARSLTAIVNTLQYYKRISHGCLLPTSSFLTRLQWVGDASVCGSEQQKLSVNPELCTVTPWKCRTVSGSLWLGKSCQWGSPGLPALQWWWLRSARGKLPRTPRSSCHQHREAKSNPFQPNPLSEISFTSSDIFYLRMYSDMTVLYIDSLLFLFLETESSQQPPTCP